MYCIFKYLLIDVIIVAQDTVDSSMKITSMVLDNYVQ